MFILWEDSIYFVDSFASPLVYNVSMIQKLFFAETAVCDVGNEYLM